MDQDLERRQKEYISKLAAALPYLIPEDKRGQFHVFFGDRIVFSSESEKEVDDYIIDKANIALAKVHPLKASPKKQGSEEDRALLTHSRYLNKGKTKLA